jgi:hypothetical protein
MIHTCRDRDRHPAAAFDLARALHLARVLATSLAAATSGDVLVPDLARALDDAYLLVSVLDRDLALDDARALASVITSRINSAIIRDRDRTVADDLGPAYDFARQLDRLLAGAEAASSSDGRLPVPMRLAGRLTAFAAGLLPGAERGRYGEEFGSELAEIARAGGGRRAQLAYAARTVLSSAWQLRAALRSPRRRGAVQ